MKHAGRRAAGAEPHIFLAERRDTRAAGGKSAFIGQRRRHLSYSYRSPACSVRSLDQRELAVHRIAHRDTMRRVPEGKAIVKSFGIFVGELQAPYLTAIGGLVDAGLLSRPDAQNERGVLVEGLDIAKIQRVSVGYVDLCPRRSAIDGPQHRSLGAAGPGYLV